ncbi:hypothetical protein [Ralstonia syzygii]|uniref:hypothetical protein n=1 Tax=Ralstonia syzygii TaxID=28097 RepID=UPI0036F30366
MLAQHPPGGVVARGRRGAARLVGAAARQRFDVRRVQHACVAARYDGAACHARAIGLAASEPLQQFAFLRTTDAERRTKKINASSNANVGYGLASCGLVDSVSSDWLQSI